MSSYNNFSPFYDIFTHNVDYKKRAEYLKGLFLKFDKMPTLLLDFACGTGNFSTEFSKMGVDVIGVDSSEGMLCVANEKNAKLARPVLYLNQRGEELDLFGTVDGAISCLDSLNHITDPAAFKKCIANVSLFLEQDRLFIFDMNTVYKHTKVLAGSAYRLKKRGVECIWNNRLLDDGLTVEITLDFTYKTGFFSKETVTEQFTERAYTEEEILTAIEAAGLRLEAVFGENTQLPPGECSQRNIYVTRKVR